MNKAILVIDMPESCNECKIRFDDEYSNWCPYDSPEVNGVYRYVKNGTKPDWCPLKPLDVLNFDKFIKAEKEKELID